MESTIISLVLVVIKEVVKNAAKKAKLKRALLSVRDAIDAAYAGE